MNQVCLVFLGRRGGGLQLLLSSITALNDFSGEILVIAEIRNRDILIKLANRDIKFEFYYIPHTLIDLKSPLKIAQSLLKIFWSIYSKKIDLIVQIMPSPFDLIVDIAAKIRKIHLSRMIHDSNTHLGEYWPNLRALKRRIKLANEVIVFSEYVEHEIEKYEKSIFILPLPSTFLSVKEFESENNYRYLENVQVPRILFIGRLLKYKGLETLVSAYSKGIDGTLIIAGEGTVGALPENVMLINRWLSDYEFNYLIASADLLVFPYIDASQSGTIPIAISQNKIIVISDSGGLEEQIRNYPLAVSSKAGDVNSLHVAIQNGLALAPKSQSTLLDGMPNPFNSTFLSYINQRV